MKKTAGTAGGLILGASSGDYFAGLYRTDTNHVRPGWL